MGSGEPQSLPPLILSFDYPPNDGGISRLTSGLVSALIERDVRPQVVTLKRHQSTGLPRPQVPCLEVSRLKGLRDWQLVRAMRAYLHHHGSHAPVLTTLWNPEASLALLAGAQRVSILAHGNEVMPYPHQGPKAWLRQAVLERAHRVICNSRFTESLVAKLAPRAQTAVLNPAVDATAFQSSLSQGAARQTLQLPLHTSLVLTVARLVPIKGHATVLRALAELQPEVRQQLLYVIVGQGPMRSALETLAADLGVAAQVHFAGFVADADLPAWYAAADLFVLASRVDDNLRGMEGFGMALTEAQAAGLPVIGSRSGGIPDAVRSNEGGWLVDENDAVGLATHFRQLLVNPTSMKEQGRRGAARVLRDFNWDQYAAKLLELI
jgi:phosphatidylinositol alpha-1,6-mannosyltransferase